MYRPNNALNSWRQIIKLDRIDIKSFLSGMNTMPFLKVVKEYYNDKFPQLPATFPIKPGKYYAKNITIVYNDPLELTYQVAEHRPQGNFDKLSASYSPLMIPNGVYRHIITFFKNDDSHVLSLYWHMELNYRMNADRY